MSEYRVCFRYQNSYGTWKTVVSFVSAGTPNAAVAAARRDIDETYGITRARFAEARVLGAVGQ